MVYIPLYHVTVIAATAVLICAVTLNAQDKSDRKADNDLAALKKQNAELRAMVDLLSEQLEGTARPINLGRTSFAAVNASGVNGGRGLANKFYGVVNAFDDGENVHNNINYTYWLSGGNIGNWIDVNFDVPVTVKSIHVEGAPPFVAKLTFQKGGEHITDKSDGRVKFDDAQRGVTSIRLTFQMPQGNCKVHEVRVMGYAPIGIKYAVGRPRVAFDQSAALVEANEAFREWAAQLTRSTPRVEKDGMDFVVTYSREGLDLCQVLVTREGKVTLMPRVELKPLRQAVRAATESPPIDASQPGTAPAPEPGTP